MICVFHCRGIPGIYNIICKCFSSLLFPIPNLIGRDPPPPAHGQWGGVECAAGVAPRGTPPQSRCTRGGQAPISDSYVLPYLYNADGPGTKIEFSWVDTAPHVEPAPPGEDRAPCPDHKSLRISTTPTPLGRKRCSPGSTPPRTLWKPQSP